MDRDLPETSSAQNSEELSAGPFFPDDGYFQYSATTNKSLTAKNLWECAAGRRRARKNAHGASRTVRLGRRLCPATQQLNGYLENIELALAS